MNVKQAATTNCLVIQYTSTRKRLENTSWIFIFICMLYDMLARVSFVAATKIHKILLVYTERKIYNFIVYNYFLITFVLGPPSNVFFSYIFSCLLWQIISFILPPNEYGCVYSCIRLAKWTCYRLIEDADFGKKIIFSDEAHFDFGGYVNKENCRI